MFKALKFQTTPFHLEIVLKSEGKSVLSYFLNEKTLQNLSQEESKILV